MKKYTCKACLKEYEIEDWRKPSSYCSRKCKDSKASSWLLKTSFIIENATDEEKLNRLKNNFEKFVIRKVDCWQWKGKSEKGYPKMTCRKKLGANLGHRASWLIYRGEIPYGLSVLHKCDNALCTNPDHLFLGSNEDNVNDMLSKKRNPRGSKVGTSKLDEDKVKQIKMLLEKDITGVEISERFGVTRTLVSYIKNGKAWKHIT